MEVLSTNRNVDDVVDPINTSPPLFGHHVKFGYCSAKGENVSPWNPAPCTGVWSILKKIPHPQLNYYAKFH